MRRRGARSAGRRSARRTVRRTSRRRYRRMRRRMRRRMVIGGMVILGVGYGAYKLTQSQVKQVETHTGKKAEDLSEEELENAMDEIGIEAQDPTDEEIAMLEAEEAKNPSVAPDVEPSPSGSASPQPEAGGEPDYIEELQRLAGLRDAGIITDEEFQAKKQQLLGL